MIFEIRHKFTAEVIFALDTDSLKNCVEAAVKNHVNLDGASLAKANLYHASIEGANLYHANLYHANLDGANLEGANLDFANLTGADLTGADLTGAKGLIKTMGVAPGHYYYKRFNDGLNNNGYQFRVGLNKLKEGEIFADDPRVLCSHPGFYFASKSWCSTTYSNRPLEALIQIPENAKINEPWATNGKASADMIDIIQVWDTATGEDVTEKFKKK